MRKWIKVKDKLPTINKWVLAATKNGNDIKIVKQLLVDSIDNGKIFWLAVGGEWHNEVTHWMPEPELPKE